MSGIGFVGIGFLAKAFSRWVHRAHLLPREYLLVLMLWGTSRFHWKASKSYGSVDEVEKARGILQTSGAEEISVHQATEQPSRAA